MVQRTFHICLLTLFVIFALAGNSHAQKDPREAGDQPILRFPLIQLKANLLAPAFGNYDFEAEVQVAKRLAFSARIGSTRSFEYQRRIGEYRCLLDQGFGFAVAARYLVFPYRVAQGLGVKATLFRSRHQEREWQCVNPSRALRKGSDTGLGFHLTWQHRIRSALFLEPFLGFNLSFSEYRTTGPNPISQKGIAFQVPVGLMLGLGF